MRINTNYRTIILQLYPNKKQRKRLLKAEEEVIKFLNTTRLKLQNMLYSEMKNITEISTRTLSLLCQRLTGSLGEKAIIPFDKVNSKFINENGFWFLELKLLKKERREKIMISRTENEYYDVIENLSTFPFMVVRENDKWFAYVSIPVNIENNGKVIGIDFNFKNWVASPYEGQPLFFNAREYSEKVERIQKIINGLYKNKEENEEKIKEYYKKIQEIVKLAHGNFLKKILEKYGKCTLAIEEIDSLYKMVNEFDNKIVNNWLYKKTALRKFVLRAYAKGFNVVEVDPENTTKLCHKCGSEVKIYGKHKRLIACEKCGYKDYNRDLNSARNLAKKCEVMEIV